MSSLALPADVRAYLRRQGPYIVDSTGKKVLLRGIGLGGWLVPEGYMLHVPGYGSPTYIRNLILDLLGPQDTELFYETYRANYVAEEDVRRIAQWGFNCIRLPFNYRLLTPEDQPGVYLEEGFQLIDRVVDWCRQNGLYLVLDMHCAPGGQNKDNISDSDGLVARLWTDPANQDRTVEIWRRLAERYADEEWVAGYDLLNEPVLPPGYDNSYLRDLYVRIVKAIREVDPNHLVFIEGNWYATDFDQLVPPFDPNIVYTFHKYWNENTVGSIRHYLNMRTLYNVPLWLGESGENSNPWFHDCVELMEDNEIGWCWWTHKKIETTTSPLSAPMTPEYRQVLEYWNGRRERPSQDLARRALLGMAENLALEKCDFHPDVLDALFRPGFKKEALPFVEHHIPGMVACVDYDMGDVGVAYYDVDYQNVHGLGSEQWNRGGAYRNDGVDIEESNDPNGPAYSVGWIEDGEWLQYSVQVDLSGVYTVELRVASPSGNGRVRLLLDGKKLTQDVDVPATGGWKKWQTVEIPGVELSQGKFALRLVFLGGGFNINYVRFNLTESSLRQGHLFEPVTKGVYVGQNYPNPFNRSTVIPVYLYEPQHIVLRIFNLRGGLVRTLFDGFLSAGVNYFHWDGTDAEKRRVPSGSYLWCVEARGSEKAKTMTIIR